MYAAYYIYADDLVILAESEQDLQVLLCQLEEWCKISINHTRSAVMHFRPKCSTCSSDLFMMNGFSLPLVSQYKYLGIILDEHLTFLPAAENCLDLASKAFSSIQSSISNVPGDAFKKLFESLVASVLDYGTPIWAHSIPRNTVERLQQHAYRCFLVLEGSMQQQQVLEICAGCKHSADTNTSI